MLHELALFAMSSGASEIIRSLDYARVTGCHRRLRWKTLSACNAERSLTRLPSRRRAARFAKTNGNSVRYGGQEWTTLERLAADHHNRFEDEAPQLLGIGTEPEFAIGQRALLLQSPGGNLLWDCISLLDDKTIAEVNARGGIRAIAISHPHFYSSMVEWAEHFDAQIFLHAPIDNGSCAKVRAFSFGKEQPLSLWDGLTLINCGGHFEGGTVLHWPAASAMREQRRVAHGRHHYGGAGPPLRQLHAKLSESYSARTPQPSIAFSKGSNHSRSIKSTAAGGKQTSYPTRKAAVSRSAQRYLRAITGLALTGWFDDKAKTTHCVRVLTWFCISNIRSACRVDRARDPRHRSTTVWAVASRAKRWLRVATPIVAVLEPCGVHACGKLAKTKVASHRARDVQC